MTDREAEREIVKRQKRRQRQRTDTETERETEGYTHCCTDLYLLLALCVTAWIFFFFTAM